MKISILYTSRRGWLVRKVAMQWLAAARDKYALEFIFTADEDDWETAAAMLRVVNDFNKVGIAAKGPFSCESPGSAAKGWNLAATKSTGDVLIAISDDFGCPAEWDYSLQTIFRYIPELAKVGDYRIVHWWEREAVVLVSDGMERSCLCATLPIISRPRYERLGYVYHPAYPSMWNDNELAEHAAQDNVLYRALYLRFPHEHYVNNKRRRDAVDAAHSSQSHFDQGRRIFEARRELGFPLDDGPRGVLEPRTAAFNPIAYILTTGDDFCVVEACGRLLESGVRNFFFSIPDQMWNGTPVDTALSTLEWLIGTLACQAGVTVYRQTVTVGRHRGRGANLFGDVEGRARNAALAEINELGFQDVLIVDDDEIWHTDLLNQVRATVEAINPHFLLANCVPVVGVPGMPVEGARDKVGIYIDAKRNRFTAGRSAYKSGAVIRVPVYHFTATRRTREEVITKMRSSAHYDDPEYGFEDWIRTRLPNLKPGVKDAHMWRRSGCRNIWPNLREWTAEELERQIPAILHGSLWRR